MKELIISHVTPVKSHFSPHVHPPTSNKTLKFLFFFFFFCGKHVSSAVDIGTGRAAAFSLITKVGKSGEISKSIIGNARGGHRSIFFMQKCFP